MPELALAAASPAAAPAASPAVGAGLRAARRADEQRHIRTVLEACGGNLSEAARRLGVGRTTLYRKLAADPG
jgi:DNA-binding NtrC family response regulator